MERMKGDPFETLKKFFGKKLKSRILNSVTVPKNVKGGPFGAIRKKSLCRKKNPNEKHQHSQRGISVCFRCSGHRFLDEVLTFRVCFERL